MNEDRELELLEREYELVERELGADYFHARLLEAEQQLAHLLSSARLPPGRPAWDVFSDIRASWVAGGGVSWTASLSAIAHLGPPRESSSRGYRQRLPWVWAKIAALAHRALTRPALRAAHHSAIESALREVQGRRTMRRNSQRSASVRWEASLKRLVHDACRQLHQSGCRITRVTVLDRLRLDGHDIPPSRLRTLDNYISAARSKKLHTNGARVKRGHASCKHGLPAQRSTGRRAAPYGQ